jgi:hypothetical protein
LGFIISESTKFSALLTNTPIAGLEALEKAHKDSFGPIPGPFTYPLLPSLEAMFCSNPKIRKAVINQDCASKRHSLAKGTAIDSDHYVNWDYRPNLEKLSLGNTTGTRMPWSACC